MVSEEMLKIQELGFQVNSLRSSIVDFRKDIVPRGISLARIYRKMNLSSSFW